MAERITGHTELTRTNGEAYARNLKEAGLDKAEVIERSNGAKVIYGRFTTQEEAKRCPSLQSWLSSISSRPL